MQWTILTDENEEEVMNTFVSSMKAALERMELESGIADEEPELTESDSAFQDECIYFVHKRLINIIYNYFTSC